MDYKKEFQKCMKDIDYSKHDYDVFRDFLNLASLSLANSFYKDEKLEKEYMEIIGRYKKNQEKFGELLGIVVCALDENPFQDFLGEIFMTLELENKRNGQFFTPYHLSLLIAKMQVSKNAIEEEINKKGYITVSEPACGSGGMVIAFAQALKEEGINPQQSFYFVATDIDQRCSNMCFIQTALLGLCGGVAWGNTLTVEQYRAYNTPMFFTEDWQTRFRINKMREFLDQFVDVTEKVEVRAEQAKEEIKPKIIDIPRVIEPKQLSLLEI